MKVRKKCPIIEAFQWFKHGDLSYVTAVPFEQKMREGQRKKLGWVETPQGGHAVFPGDWVLIHKDGTLGTCNPVTFARLYEQVDSRILPTPGQSSRMV